MRLGRLGGVVAALTFVIVPRCSHSRPRVCARNGPAVLAVRAGSLASGSLYGHDCRPLLMDPDSSVDIDGPADFAYAEYLLSRALLPEPLREP